MGSTAISFRLLYKKYKKVINIVDYMHPKVKWTHLLPDNTDVRNTQFYIDDNSTQEIIKECIAAGAQMFQLKVVNKDDEIEYPFFSVKKLLANEPLEKKIQAKQETKTKLHSWIGIEGKKASVKAKCVTCELIRINGEHKAYYKGSVEYKHAPECITKVIK